ncbi:MAG: pirin family protein [Cyclobacteriaceae bacterium]
MNNDKLLVEERSRDIGKFLVGRLLPFRKKRQVGPFTFIDHMGPTVLEKRNYINVDQHPHIGLSTLTYLLAGEIEHRDSTRAVQIIRPGDVGFMTAGKGVTHTERTPNQSKVSDSLFVHGYQVWVAMPKDKEEMEPRFDFVASDKIPTLVNGGLSIKVVAGKAFGLESPLPVHSPLFMVDITSDSDSELKIDGQVEGEIAFVVVKGKVNDEDQEIETGQMLISKSEDECRITLEKGTQLLMFGGKPFPEERYLYWNFVSSSKERLEQAKSDWQNKRFPKVPSDSTYIPLP